MKNMSILSKSNQGFTLIELVIVIVILGILAAVALPKFVDLKTDARTSALNGVAGAISSGSATNYAAKLAGKSTAINIDSTNVCTTAILGSLLTGGMPTGFTAGAATGNCANTANETVACLVGDGASPPIFGTAIVVCAR